MSLLRKLLRRSGEDKATDDLAQRSFVIFERNSRTQSGEIDLIALDGDTVKKLHEMPCRFDMVAINGTSADEMTLIPKCVRDGPE